MKKSSISNKTPQFLIMNSSVNKVILIGNLGDEVKIHYFNPTNILARFRLATSEAYLNKEGEKIVQTEWHTIVVKNKLAEVCEKYLQKGDKVYVEGKLKTRKWEEAGTIKYNTEIMTDKIQFLSVKKTINLNQVEDTAHNE